ncbi:hypothetical protein CK203_072383 [Vitis vinifera]|uniref:Uncharacterized protein n=1 Tax=Vitis vinifera TaxID=29760 RepID=A0A438E8H8_VITVI|nr:hypothetical protein CK203_072383 [Vitis vinifera]
MSRLPEITDLFARLASNLKTLYPTDKNEDCLEGASDPSISELNRSLNLDDEGSSVRVLDAALSLMCFKAPQASSPYLNKDSGVFESRVEYLVKTIVAVISSSISCKVSRFQREEVFLIGSSISRYDCTELIEACTDVIGRLKGHGKLPLLLSYAVVRVAALSSRYRCLFPLTPILHEQSIKERSNNISKLLFHFPGEFSLKNHEIPFRGLASVLQLLIEVVSMILDVVSRPTGWGISVEMGSKLPFSIAYFPYNHHVYRILSGTLSSESFLHLVSIINVPISRAGNHSMPTIKQVPMKISTIGHKSVWAAAMNFPDWFFFASVLLFSEKSFQDNFYSKCGIGVPRTEKRHDVEPLCFSSAAARYIAWILSPADKSHQDLLVDWLTKLSESWTLKQFGSDTYNKEIADYRKKLKKTKFPVYKGDYNLPKEYNYVTIVLWLKEFQNSYTKNQYKTASSLAFCEHNLSYSLRFQHSVLFRRIPLGILIGCPYYLDESGCEMLLHYSATGTIPLLRETHSGALKHLKLDSEGQKDSIMWTEEYTKEEAAAGASLVFRLTDVVLSMAASLFETDESGLEFICQVKVKAGRYLIKCIKKLLQFNDGIMLMDLFNRLVQWRNQGQEVFQGCTDLDDVINGLGLKLSSL